MVITTSHVSTIASQYNQLRKKKLFDFRKENTGLHYFQITLLYAQKPPKEASKKVTEFDKMPNYRKII